MPLPKPKDDEEKGRIGLANGGIALIDSADCRLIVGHQWFAVMRRNTMYAVANIRGKVVYMHRLILTNVPAIDHVNGNGLDNRRSNLRSATASENAINSPARSGSSRFKGVCWHRSAMKWMAQIGVRGHHVYLGLFKSEEDAARAYDKAAQRAFGPYAWLNFIGETS